MNTKIIAHCWKCDNQNAVFSKSYVSYVKKKTGGRNYTCDDCVGEWKADNNIEEIEYCKDEKGRADWKYKYK